jgi:hypothetical protein
MVTRNKDEIDEDNNMIIWWVNWYWKRLTCASVEWKPQIHAQEEEEDWNLNEKRSNWWNIGPSIATSRTSPLSPPPPTSHHHHQMWLRYSCWWWCWNYYNDDDNICDRGRPCPSLSRFLFYDEIANAHEQRNGKGKPLLRLPFFSFFPRLIS